MLPHPVTNIRRLRDNRLLVEDRPPDLEFDSNDWDDEITVEIDALVDETPGIGRPEQYTPKRILRVAISLRREFREQRVHCIDERLRSRDLGYDPVGSFVPGRERQGKPSSVRFDRDEVERFEAVAVSANRPDRQVDDDLGSGVMQVAW